MTLGLIVLTLSVPAAVVEARRLERLHAAVVESQDEEPAGNGLSRKQREDLDEWQAVVDEVQPDEETVQDSLAAHLGSYWQLFVLEEGIPWGFYGRRFV